jgi:hypothetical protein
MRSIGDGLLELDESELLEPSSPRGRFCFFSGILNRDRISKKSSSSSISLSVLFPFSEGTLVLDVKEFVDA